MEYRVAIQLDLLKPQGLTDFSCSGYGETSLMQSLDERIDPWTMTGSMR
jgi:hypothetical protein